MRLTEKQIPFPESYSPDESIAERNDILANSI